MTLGVFNRRRAGILLHATSLPSGTLGADARRFVDFLSDTGTSVWQMLPLGPTHDDRSPYHCLSVHALNPALLDLEQLAQDHALTLAGMSPSNCLQRALATLQHPDHRQARAAFEVFAAVNARWLEDYAIFVALRDRYNARPWWEWPAALRDRDPMALERAQSEFAETVNFIRFEQFVLAHQFAALRAHACARGVCLFGDLPIFVAHDSADVWAHRRFFKLDELGRPRMVAGVPPDYFSSTGQRWGNPQYDWSPLQQDGFRWWIDRMDTELQRFDIVRIDHFRGFESSWEIPASEQTAINGHWTTVPGDALFTTLQAHFGALPLVAEDLGIITPEVTALRRRHHLPGMLVLQFAFDGSADNPYLPHNHTRDAVVYTGTHDNEPSRSWFEALRPAEQNRVLDYIDTREPMPRALMHLALHSVAQLAIIPMQDLLGLGAESRMNTPGTTEGNWRWRFRWEQLEPDAHQWWQQAVARAGRTVAPAEPV